jgi:hypothetical protein
MDGPKGESGTHEHHPGKSVFMGSGLPLRCSRKDATGVQSNCGTVALPSSITFAKRLRTSPEADFHIVKYQFDTSTTTNPATSVR